MNQEGSISKKLYNISEKIRCENIGTSYFKGVKNNIEKLYNKKSFRFRSQKK